MNLALTPIGGLYTLTTYHHRLIIGSPSVHGGVSVTVQHYLKIIDVEGFASATQRYLALELALRADRKGVVRMPQSELAQVTKLSPATVKRLFRDFEDVGLIERVGHGRYQFNLGDPDVCAELLGTSSGPKSVTLSPEAEAELSRLQRIRRPDQSLRFRPDGWPVLVND